MGRKNLLDGLMAPAARAAAPGAGPDMAERPAGPPGDDGPAAARRGAVGAVGRSIAELRQRAVIAIDPDRIDPDGPADRLGDDPDELARLAASMAAHGQQVPVLVRPHESDPSRFRIVYGRRRVAAARLAGLEVRALLRDLDDRAAALAQGQENTQRRDLSFIERVHLARQLRDLGYDRATVGEALNADKTLVSRLLSLADRLPVAVIEAVGSAPGVGRARWLALADLLEAAGWDPDAAAALATAPPEAGPDARFEALHHALTLRRRRTAEARKAAARARTLKGADGAPLGQASAGPRVTTLALRHEAAEGFADWLIDRLPALHAEWRAGGARDES